MESAINYFAFLWNMLASSIVFFLIACGIVKIPRSSNFWFLFVVGFAILYLLFGSSHPYDGPGEYWLM